MSYHGHFESQKPKKKGKKIGLIILAVVLVLVLAVVGVVLWYYNDMMSSYNYVEMPKSTYAKETEPTAAATEAAETTAVTEATTEETTVETTVPPMRDEDILNVLVVGNASRAGEGAAMADTMILVTVNKYTNDVTLTSFLRDTYVDLPDYRDSRGTMHSCGWNKMTSCYALGYSWDGFAGGMEMMNQCVYNNFGVEVDYNVELDFTAVEFIINYVGGVDLELTEAEAAYLNSDDNYVYYDVQPGLQHLDGLAALSYARMRKAEGDNDSDIKRTSRQRYMIEQLLNKIKGMNVFQLYGMATDMLEYVTTNISPNELANLIFDFGPVLANMTLNQGTCPVQGQYWNEYKDTPDGNLPCLIFDQGQHKQLMRAFTETNG